MHRFDLDTARPCWRRRRRARSPCRAVRSEQRHVHLGRRHDRPDVRRHAPPTAGGPRPALAHRLRRLRHLPRARLQRRRAGLGRRGRRLRGGLAARRRRGGRGLAPRGQPRRTSRTSSTTSTPPATPWSTPGTRPRTSWRSSAAPTAGLLVGAALTQRPDRLPGRRLLGAAAGHGPLRASSRSAAPGTTSTAPPTTRTSWAGCCPTPPTTTCEPGTGYPAVLFTVFDSDTRVDPLHARKMCAALQHATAGDLDTHPMLLRRETDVGHGARSVSRSVALGRGPAVLPRRPHRTARDCSPIPLTTAPVPTPVPTTDRPARSCRRRRRGRPRHHRRRARLRKDPGSWCERFYQWTDNDFLARSADVIVAKSFTIAPHRPARADRPLPAAPGDQPARRGRRQQPGLQLISRRTRAQVGEGAAAPVSTAAGPAGPHASARCCGRSARSWSARSRRRSMMLAEFGVAWPRSSPRRASSGSRSASARRTSSRTSSPACSCCWRTSTASATSSTSGWPAAPSRPSGLRITTVRDVQRHGLVRPQRRDPAGGQQEPGLRRRRRRTCCSRTTPTSRRPSSSPTRVAAEAVADPDGRRARARGAARSLGDREGRRRRA